MTPEFSVVLPAYNEEEIILNTLGELAVGLSALRVPYEILVCENGSTDETRELVSEYAKNNQTVRPLQLDRPSYSQALKAGIAAALAEKIIIFNVDFYNLNFAREALNHLDEFDLVTGSKNLPESEDLRPIHRRFITRAFNAFLKLAFGFAGTDTHGIKALRKSVFTQIAQDCKTDGEIFDTEMILRAQRKGLKFKELPVKILEVRPSRYSLSSRIRRTFFDLVTLAKHLK